MGDGCQGGGKCQGDRCQGGGKPRPYHDTAWQAHLYHGRGIACGYPSRRLYYQCHLPAKAKGPPFPTQPPSPLRKPLPAVEHAAQGHEYRISQMYCRRKEAKLLAGAYQPEFLIVYFCSKLPTSSKERTEMGDSRLMNSPDPSPGLPRAARRSKPQLL